MGALGLFLGFENIIVVAVMAFLLGAVVSIFLIASRIRKSKDYIPFGPFIVVATMISIFVPFDFLFNILMTIFTLGIFA
ncbi:MAG: hypothetical protein FWC79_02200 [Oscillospiraceae bacterium]|nr:hypothetical protein [Oscillospiraceae bacterium]